MRDVVEGVIGWACRFWSPVIAIIISIMKVPRRRDSGVEAASARGDRVNVPSRADSFHILYPEEIDSGATYWLELPNRTMERLPSLRTCNIMFVYPPLGVFSAYTVWPNWNDHYDAIATENYDFVVNPETFRDGTDVEWRSFSSLSENMHNESPRQQRSQNLRATRTFLEGRAISIA
jgi:hypothetical protein